MTLLGPSFSAVLHPQKIQWDISFLKNDEKKEAREANSDARLGNIFLSYFCLRGYF